MLFTMVIIPIVENSNIASVESDPITSTNGLTPTAFFKEYDTTRGNIVIDLTEGVTPQTVNSIITDTFMMTYASGSLTFTDRFGTETYSALDITSLTIDVTDMLVVAQGSNAEELNGLEYAILLVNSSRSMATYGMYSGNTISETSALYVEEDVTTFESSSSKLQSGTITTLPNIGGGIDDTKKGIFNITSAVESISLIVPIDYVYSEITYVLDKDSKTMLGIIALVVILGIMYGLVHIYFIGRRY